MCYSGKNRIMRSEIKNQEILIIDLLVPLPLPLSSKKHQNFQRDWYYTIPSCGTQSLRKK